MKYEKLKYQPNKLAQTFTLLGMIFMSFALFKVINVYRFNPRQGVTSGSIPANIWLGVEILVAILVMLISFLASERFKFYDKKWLPVGIGLTVYPIIKIFMYPLIINKKMNQMIANGEPLKYNPKTWLPVVIISLLLSAILYAIATFITYKKVKQLDEYYKELDAQ